MMIEPGRPPFFSLSSAYEYDPSLAWFVLETDHFAIHVPSISGLDKEEENLARRFARACEDAASVLSPFMEWRPKEKVNVVIADFYDYAQGWSLPFPHNTITVMPTHPAGDFVNYDDWFRTLIIHEYTHTVQMDRVHGLMKILRHIFGRVIIPSALTPLWMLEGFAVYNESKFTRFGRASSPDNAMKIRTAALTNRLLPIDRATTYELRRYPGSEAPYLYGGQFYSYLARKYGEPKLIEYSNRYSGCLPFFINLTAQKVFFDNFCQLWGDWKDEIKRKTVERPDSWREDPTRTEQAETLKLKSLTQSVAVTNLGFDLYAPQFSRYGEKIYFVSYNPNELPSIKSIDLLTKETKTLVKGFIGKSLGLSSDGGKLIFSMRNIAQNYYDYDDIFIYSITTNERYRLTNGMRGRDPDFTLSGDSIIFVENGMGKNRLMIMERKTNKVEPLMEEEDYTQFAQPKFAPDGKKIAVGVWKEGGYQDILVLDLENGWQMLITYDRATDIQPAWTPDSKYLLFSSDRTGIFNLYAYSFENKQIYQVTNVLAGAFAPAVSPDGKRIAFLNYSERGYDIHFISFKPSSWQQSKNFVDSLPLADSTKKEIRVNIYHYSPLSSLFPKFWLPLVYYDTSFSLGLFTAGADVLLHHILIFVGTYRLDAKRPWLYFAYLGQKYPFSLYGSYEQDEQSAGLTGYIPFYSTFSYHLLLPYYDFNRDSLRIFSGVGLDWQTSNAKKYPYSIALVDGRTISIDASHYNRYLGSDYELTKFRIRYSGYSSMPIRHHAIAFKIVGATGFGDSLVKRQFRLGGNYGTFSLRGYEQDSLLSQNAIKTSLEYSFPLVWLERGLGTAPLFLSNFSAGFGVDAGLGWDDLKLPNTDLITKQAKLGAFFELRTSLVLAYFLPVSIRCGYARGLINNGTEQFYFSAGSSLLSLLNEKKRLTRKDIKQFFPIQY
ncbi:MAG: hypothetical protein OEZ20_01580 [candidate division WOR-3 bacterium]|nr:hypothetical protein [candidate division WOR-3 bacterium]